jgi:ribosomal protein L37AE/L43A
MNKPTYEELLRENERLRQENARLTAGKAQTEEQAGIFARLAQRFLSWWHTLYQHYKKLKAEKQWDDELFSNQQLKPADKLIERALRPLILRSTHPEGFAPVTEAWIRQRTGVPESTQQAARARLEAAGILRCETVFDKIQGRSHLFVAFTEDALSSPAGQTLPPDAPKNGGYRGRVCEACGGQDFKVESQLRKRFTCRSCGTQDVLEMPWKPIEEVTPQPTVYDGEETRTEQDMKEPRNQPGGSQSEPHIRITVSSDVSRDTFHMSREAKVPCSTCGGTIERLALDKWVCATCQPNPFWTPGRSSA